MLTEYQFDNNYAKNVPFTTSANKGKLVVSKTILLIVQHLEKSIRVVVAKEKILYNNVKLRIVEYAKNKYTCYK